MAVALAASKAFAIFVFKWGLESLDHYSLIQLGSLLGAHPSIAPFTFKLPKNTQEHAVVI